MLLCDVDVAGSILLIAVGNCLENVFRNTVMARVMVRRMRPRSPKSGTLLLTNIMVVFETCFNSGLSLVVSLVSSHW